VIDPFASKVDTGPDPVNTTCCPLIVLMICWSVVFQVPTRQEAALALLVTGLALAVADAGVDAAVAALADVVAPFAPPPPDPPP